MRPVPACLLLLCTALPLAAQAPLGAPDTSAFRRLELPPPSATRSASGAPGQAYWQQRADYVIRASLDTVSRTLRGEERITYTNNSPDTLRFLWLHLDQNLFTPDSRGHRVFNQRDDYGRGADVGLQLLKVAAGGSSLPHTVNGTLVRVDLAKPLPPRGKQGLDLEWTMAFGPHRNRMGIEEIDGSVVYEVAQWYPRVAVYDDIRGWNADQYYGQGEFYLEYGSFDVSLTVPANMILAATGVLQNPNEVLTPAQRSRLTQARTSPTTVIIRGRDEVADPTSRPGGAGRLTWHFKADSVRDFAFAAASHFIWDAVGVNGGKTLVMSFYPPSADSLWKHATEYAKFAIETNSADWAPYPYPVASNVRGVEGGMEYPMIVFCNRGTPETLYSVTDHEFGHTWFPMVVGSNERRYGWMDEGLNELLNYYSWTKRFGKPPTHRASRQDYLAMATSGMEKPIMTAPDQLSPHFVSPAAYDKPSLALRLLREVVLGPERFDPAFKEYYRRWAYKHPTPADFFRTIENVAGEDLSWFWRSWFFTTQHLDQVVDSITIADSAGVESRIHLRNAGQIPMPVDLALVMDDGSTERLRLPVEIWFQGDRFTALVPGPRRVQSARVDPEGQYPDVDTGNNEWRGPARTNTP